MAPAKQSEEPATPEPGSDAFTKSKFVYGLKWDTFDDFIKQKDVTLVMFYNTQNEGCRFCKPRFIEAAEMTERENHAFAAVNCRVQEGLCARENVTTLPLFRLYSKGLPVNTVTDVGRFDAETMKTFVENAPVHQDVRRFRTPNPKIHSE